MVERTRGWQETFRAELPKALARRKMSRAQFVKKMTTPPEAGGLKLASTQAVYKWLNHGQISDDNLEKLAAFLDVDYPTLLVSGRFTPKAKMGRRREDAIRDAAAGYAIAGLPDADDVAERWAALPAPVQAFLLQQIMAYEEIARRSPALNDLMFNPPKNGNYPEYEHDIELWQAQRRKSSESSR